MAYGEVGGGDDEGVLVALEAIELCKQGVDHTHGVGGLVARDGRLTRRLPKARRARVSSGLAGSLPASLGVGGL